MTKMTMWSHQSLLEGKKDLGRKLCNNLLLLLSCSHAFPHTPLHSLSLNGNFLFLSIPLFYSFTPSLAPYYGSGTILETESATEVSPLCSQQVFNICFEAPALPALKHFPSSRSKWQRAEQRISGIDSPSGLCLWFKKGESCLLCAGIRLFLYNTAHTAGRQQGRVKTQVCLTYICALPNTLTPPAPQEPDPPLPLSLGIFAVSLQGGPH